MEYRVIAETAMLLHFAFLVFVVFGGFLTWRWPHAAWAHIPVALYGLGIAVVGWVCPLTHVENWGRDRAGQAGLAETGFMEHYLAGIIYPEGHLRTAQSVAGVVVVASYVGAVLWRQRRGRAAAQPLEPA